MTARGSVYAESAYAQGKMLDHSAWSVLPRRITPSDVDMCIDNNGNTLLCELSRDHRKWSDISTGQLRLYASIVGPASKHLAVLLKHSVPVERQIDTRNDIESIQVMVVSGRECLFTPVWNGAMNWQNFVSRWFEAPDELRRTCIERAAANTDQVDVPSDCAAWIAAYKSAYVVEHGVPPW